jgi:hypothetical protein
LQALDFDFFWCGDFRVFSGVFGEFGCVERGVLRGKSWWICGDFVVERTALNGAWKFSTFAIFIFGRTSRETAVQGFRGSFAETG